MRKGKPGRVPMAIRFVRGAR
ncbi:Protein of unknown function [Pyronema omphalodes CBS 100304]|uniref:Uncharacterized protein n=1 Tax=Pyronema omphalodes (strain CBS 100304) TaxID=1076935 RepID=U4KX47_PYROM|nr:Protein of unknown function [Pyronema omphalodes CBS 100304]